ncbi:MAG: hypothetical protein AAF090_08830 [Bacteroidota bacterium]
MKKSNPIILALLSLAFINCKTEKHQFPIEKRYWDTEDYNKVTLELNYGYESDERLPSFDDPETRVIVQKLTDHENYKIVLDDEELGIRFKNEVAETFFKEWKGMTDIYDATDRKDKFLYDKELLAVWHFGLGLQLKYFKLGNDQIIENADDPSAKQVQRRLNSNINTLIKNYLIYIDKVNNEKAFSEEGKSKLAEGIDTYYTALIELYPDADYGEMKKKAELLIKKSKSDRIKSSLNALIELINSKEHKE